MGGGEKVGRAVLPAVVQQRARAAKGKTAFARFNGHQRDSRCGARPFGVAGHVKVTVRGVRLHGRCERAFGDDARIKDQYRYEVGSGPKRRVGASGDADPFVAREFLGAVVKDRPPVLNHVVLSKTDIQIHIDIGVDGFQREGDAGGGLRSLQPE